jgi:hypothetical protein
LLVTNSDTKHPLWLEEQNLIGKPTNLSPLRLPTKKKKIEFLSAGTKPISCGLATLLVLSDEL